MRKGTCEYKPVWRLHFYKNEFLWFLTFLAFVNPAYLDRFAVFDLFTTGLKLLLFGYFLVFKVFPNKLPIKIVPWIIYALLPTMITVNNGGDTRSGLVYSFIVISTALIFFYVNDRHVKSMISGLALTMEILIFINFLSIVFMPGGLYLYETDAGWWSSDVWFLGLRNSHSPFLCLACFSATLDYYVRGGLIKKIVAILTHIVAFTTVLLLSSGGGIVSFSVYFIMLFALGVINKTNLKPIIVKTRFVVAINICLFIFLSFFAAGSNFANVFSIIGDQRVYTMGRRMTIWAAVWEEIIQAPFLGHGFMTADELIWLSNLAAGATSSHNSMIDICFRGGFITLLAYCIMLISSGKFVDDSRNLDCMRKNFFAASWFTILLLLQSEGSMMSIPLLTIVGLTLKVGKAVETGKLQFRT